MKEAPVICINRGGIKNLTIGKQYTITKRNNGVHRDSNKSYSNVWVINDIGLEKHYASKRFISVEDWRQKQFEKIGV